MWNLISGLKTLRENSVQIFLLAIWSLDVLKRIVKIFPKRLLNKEIKKPGLKFNPGLGLIGLWTTGPWFPISEQWTSCCHREIYIAMFISDRVKIKYFLICQQTLQESYWGLQIRVIDTDYHIGEIWLLRGLWHVWSWHIKHLGKNKSLIFNVQEISGSIARVAVYQENHCSFSSSRHI